MDSVAVTVPLRPPIKKMKKRKELDALAPSYVISRRTSGKRSSQELLTDSSDERSEYWNVSVRGNRKARVRRNRTCPGFLKACGAFFGCASVLATASLIWLFIDVRQQLTSVRTEVDQAIAGNEGVPEALQKCHSLSKDLLKNQTKLFNQLTDVKAQITNFTTQLIEIEQSLRQAHNFLNNPPKLSSVMTHLTTVSTSVASIQSRIDNLEETEKNLKDQLSTLHDSQHLLELNFTDTMPILYSLHNTTLNTSMKVESLEKECAKVSEQASINSSVIMLTDEIEHTRAINLNLSGRVQQLEQSYSKLKATKDAIITSTAKSPKEHADEVITPQVTPKPADQVTSPVNKSSV